MIKKYASLLSASAVNYGKIIKKLEKENYDGLHFDIMDGHFVRNFAFSPHIIKCLRDITDLPFNVHLEIENPGEYLDMFIDAGCNIMTIHPQTSNYTERELRYLRAKGILTSLAIDPDIEVNYIEKYLPLVDNVIVLSVYPGFGEQKFIKKSLQKIKKIKDTVTNNDLDITVSVDGCVNEQTAKSVIEHGADILIYGSSIF